MKTITFVNMSIIIIIVSALLSIFIYNKNILSETVYQNDFDNYCKDLGYNSSKFGKPSGFLSFTWYCVSEFNRNTGIYDKFFLTNEEIESIKNIDED